MSVSALRLAVRDRIRATVCDGLRHLECDVSDGGRPFANGGILFIGVHGGGARNIGISGGHHLHESVGVNVTISMREGRIPTDMAGSRAIDDTEEGLEFFAQSVKQAIHGRFEVLAAANAMIPDESIRFIVGTYLRFEDSTEAYPRAGDWWGARRNRRERESDLRRSAASITGFSVTMRFAGAERITPTGSFT